jgi:hypothetical protein
VGDSDAYRLHLLTAISSTTLDDSDASRIPERPPFDTQGLLEQRGRLQTLNSNITQVLEDIWSVNGARRLSITHSFPPLGHQHHHPSSQ